MNKILVMAKKEWRNYFASPLGYVFAGMLLVVANWIFWGDVFLFGTADIKPLIMTITFLLSIFIPAISMGMLADEKKHGNWEMLNSLPITHTEIVMGKMLAAAMFLVFCILLTVPSLISLMFLGQPEMGIALGGYIGLILLSWAYLSVGIFMSSLSVQAVVGFLAAAIFLILNNMMSSEIILNRVSPTVGRVLAGLSLGARVENFGDGLITLSDLVFFVTFILFFITMTIMNLKRNDK